MATASEAADAEDRTIRSYSEIKGAFKNIRARYRKDARSKTLMNAPDDLMKQLESALEMIEESERDAQMAAELGCQLLEKVKRLEKEVDKRNKAIEEKDRELIQMERAMQAMDPEDTPVDDLNDSFEGRKKKKGKGWDSSIRYHSEKKIIRQRMLSTEYNLQEMTEQICKKDEQIRELQRTIDTLSSSDSQKEKLLDELDDSRTEISQHKKRIEELNKQCDKVGDEKSKLQAALEEAYRQVELRQDELRSYADLQTSMAQLKSQLDATTEENRKLKAIVLEKVDSQKTIDVLSRAKDALYNEVCELKQLLEEANKKIRSVSTEQRGEDDWTRSHSLQAELGEIDVLVGGRYQAHSAPTLSSELASVDPSPFLEVPSVYPMARSVVSSASTDTSPINMELKAEKTSLMEENQKLKSLIENLEQKIDKISSSSSSSSDPLKASAMASIREQVGDSKRSISPSVSSVRSQNDALQAENKRLLEENQQLKQGTVTVTPAPAVVCVPDSSMIKTLTAQNDALMREVRELRAQFEASSKSTAPSRVVSGSELSIGPDRSVRLGGSRDLDKPLMAGSKNKSKKVSKACPCVIS
eukprot:GILJ01002043.1.p1 GENE.GILJ01002043.1~~GILJ01002043.1.p1  ORF type:complete len:601 (+),score=120.76 GILJ01002043.1:48-1805(+)